MPVVVVEFPIPPQLQKTIDTSPIGNMTFLVTEYGRPSPLGGPATGCASGVRRPACTTSRWMGAAQGQSLHRCRDRRATDEDLMTLFGWVTKSQTTHYTNNAR